MHVSPSLGPAAQAPPRREHGFRTAFLHLLQAVYGRDVTELEQILGAIAGSGAAYLVVGGVAVVLHGYPRFTADLDLVVRLDRDNVLKLLGALTTLDYRPRAPVPAEEFADSAKREEWIRDKGLTVFSLWSPRYPMTEIDLFVREPFDFAHAHSRALRAELGATTVTVTPIQELIALKRASGRPRDLADIEVLEAIAEAGNER